MGNFRKEYLQKMIPFDYKIHLNIATSYYFGDVYKPFLFAFSENNFKNLL